MTRALSPAMVNLPPASEATPRTVDGLSALFPVAWPVPTPVTHPDMLKPQDVHREEDLLRNPHSFRHWWAAIATARDHCATLAKAQPADEIASLLGPLASSEVRVALQRVVYLFEAALEVFPTSFKLWKAYLQTRSFYILGRAIKPKRAGGRKKFAPMKDDLEAEMDDLEKWDGGLDGILGWSEWKSLVATFERALMWLPNVCSTHSASRRNTVLTLNADATPLVDVLQPLLPPQMPAGYLCHARSPNL